MKGIFIEILSDKVKKINGLPSCWGKIQINDFKEKFIMSVAQWTIADYKRQWKEGLERIKTHDISCLVTNVQNPLGISGLEQPLIVSWPCYKVKDKIFVQNNLAICQKLRKKLAITPFTIENCYEFIEPRRKGAKVSEWIVNVADLENSNLLI